MTSLTMARRVTRHTAVALAIIQSALQGIFLTACYHYASTGQVLGNQVTPISVTLDGTEHVADVDLEMVAQTLKPGQKVTLQVFGSSASAASGASFA